MNALKEVIREYKDDGESEEVAKQANIELNRLKRIERAAKQVTEWKPRGISAVIDELHDAVKVRELEKKISKRLRKAVKEAGQK